MMEADWNSNCPESMLNVVRQLNVGKSQLGRRKLRLFACACIRNWWDDLNSESREALEITQRYAIGNATRTEFGKAQRIARYDFGNVSDPLSLEDTLNRHTVNGATNWLTSGAEIAGFRIGQHLRAVASLHSNDKLVRENERQVVLLHEVFGTPANPASIDPDWLRWNNGAIPKLASELYTDPRSGNYAQLWLQLKLAGCDEHALLDHCLSPHSHVVGCWLLDTLLGLHWPKRKGQNNHGMHTAHSIKRFYLH